MTTVSVENSVSARPSLIDRIRTSSLVHPLIAFLVTRTIVFVAAYLSEIALPSVEGDGFYHVAPNNLWLDVWARWDSAFYISIVNDGYAFVPGQVSSAAFFPLYPLLTKMMSFITGDTVAAAVVVSNLALLGGLIAIYKLAELEFDSDSARRTVYYLAAFPTAYYFSAIYTESLFLCVSVAAVYFARRRMWAWATLFALLTSVTRIVGLGIWGIVGLEWLRTHGWMLGTIHRAEAWRNLWHGLRTDWYNLLILFIAPLGFASHAAFLGRAFGDPFAFWTIQSAWQRESLGVVRILIKEWTPILSQNFGTGDIWWHVILDTTALIAGLIITYFVWRRLGAGYAIYMLLSLILPANSGTQSMTRYVLVLFPIFLMLGWWGRNRHVHNTLLVGFSCFLGIFTAIFVNWVFIA